MNPRILGLVVLGLVLCLPTAAGVGGHYVPETGDSFHYYETVVLNNGLGTGEYGYSGYTEHYYVNGSIGVTGVLPNGTESASYQNTNSWSNNTGSFANWNSAGSFTFSATTFLYVDGTDNQTGYTTPSVWFYMNNSLPVGGSFSLLDYPMDVVSKSYSYDLPGTGSVQTIYAEGTGNYQRNDEYGDLNAAYTWQAYFDPGTGYMVGYLYTEQDTNSSGDGFTWTDTLLVTSTTYALTPAQSSISAPATVPWGLIIAIVVVLLIVAVVVWLAVRSRNRPKRLPQHAAPGNIGYGAPPPPFYPTAGAPPINLTPSGQPVPQVVLRETVKVQCRYCGNLIDVTDKVCPNCGAPLV
ncbi:MAG: zinc ribbon domain-containing protein [Thermoplasmata archaeon]